jgi:nucleoside-diphosphate-sugar epimerase
MAFADHSYLFKRSAISCLYSEKMKKVILTGATGFIGRHTIPFLRFHGYEVHAICFRNNPKEAEENGIIWHRLDLFDQGETSKLLKKVQPSHLLHFAWDVTPGKYWSSESNIHWVQASLNLISSFASNGGGRVVIAGSCAEYDGEFGRCVEKETPFRPASLYGACKRALHLMLEVYAKERGLNLTWGYIFYLFGPGENACRFLPSIIRGLLQKEEVSCSHGNQIRDFLYVQDVAHAFVKLLESSLIGGVNIGSGKGISLKDLAQKVVQKIGGEDYLKFGALTSSQQEPLELIADTKRLSEELQWQPVYSLDKGIEETVEWWKRNL